MDVVGVVAGPARMIILALGHAIADEDGQEGGRQELGVEPFDDVVAQDLDIHEMADLLLECGEQLVVRLELGRIAGLQADRLARARIDAVVEGDLEDLGHVEVPGQGVVLLAESPGLDAAAGPAVAGILGGLALPDELLDDGVGVEDRRLAEAGLDDPQGPPEEGIGPLGRNLDHGAGLQDAHLLDDLEEEEGQRVDAVRAVGFEAADVDQGEIGIRPALLGRHADLRRGGLIVELDPKTF